MPHFEDPEPTIGNARSAVAGEIIARVSPENGRRPNCDPDFMARNYHSVTLVNVPVHHLPILDRCKGVKDGEKCVSGKCYMVHPLGSRGPFAEECLIEEVVDNRGNKYSLHLVNQAPCDYIRY
ncbi:hypothetical protein ACN47E_006567 [Coniothyrium glycines]